MKRFLAALGLVATMSAPGVVSAQGCGYMPPPGPLGGLPPGPPAPTAGLPFIPPVMPVLNATISNGSVVLTPSFIRTPDWVYFQALMQEQAQMTQLAVAQAYAAGAQQTQATNCTGNAY